MNITLTLNEAQQDALRRALYMVECGRQDNLEQDYCDGNDEWARAHDSLDEIWDKIEFEQTVNEVAQRHPDHSKTVVRKHVRTNWK
jgi:DNA-binding IscR family transcriptional regulator